MTTLVRCTIAKGTYFVHDENLYYVVDESEGSLLVENCKSLETEWLEQDFFFETQVEIVEI